MFLILPITMAYDNFCYNGLLKQQSCAINYDWMIIVAFSYKIRMYRYFESTDFFFPQNFLFLFLVIINKYICVWGSYQLLVIIVLGRNFHIKEGLTLFTNICLNKFILKNLITSTCNDYQIDLVVYEFWCVK